MSIAADTAYAEVERQLRADLAASRLAHQRAEEANDALRQRVWLLEKTLRTLEIMDSAHELRKSKLIQEIGL